MSLVTASIFLIASSVTSEAVSSVASTVLAITSSSSTCRSCTAFCHFSRSAMTARSMRSSIASHEKLSGSVTMADDLDNALLLGCLSHRRKLDAQSFFRDLGALALTGEFCFQIGNLFFQLADDLVVARVDRVELRCNAF